MRTNIEIDDKLMKAAMKASRLETKTKKAVVEEALQMLVQVRGQEGILKWFGKVEFWEDGKKRGDKDKWAEAESRHTAESRKTRGRSVKRKAA